MATSTSRGSAGSPAGFDDFVQATHGRLRRMAVIMLAGDIGQADELVSDVLLTMYKSWEGIERPHLHATVITARRIVQNSAEASAKPTLLRKFRTPERPRVLSGPGTLDEAHDDVPLVPRQLAVLPPQQRVIAVMWWLYDWSPKDISEALQIRPRVVDRQLQRAQATMLREFGLDGRPTRDFGGFLDGGEGSTR